MKSLLLEDERKGWTLLERNQLRDSGDVLPSYFFFIPSLIGLDLNIKFPYEILIILRIVIFYPTSNDYRILSEETGRFRGC